MCRLLLVKKNEKFDVKPYLEEFSNISKNAKHYQGDGWGFCYLDDNNEWQIYRNVKPMWEDDLENINVKTKLLIAHTRDALRLHTINVENNMPLVDGDIAFAFNGRLNRVKIKIEGKTGAHKVFNIFLEKINEKGFDDGIKEAIDYIQSNTEYIKAMNLMISNKEKTYVLCRYSEEEDFFQINYMKNENEALVCSQMFLDATDKKMKNGKLMVIR